LRHLNNNPSIWGKDHRPIVEFAIDNVQALKKRAARLAKQQQGNADGNSQHTAAELDTKANGKNKKENRAPADEQDGGSKSKRQLRKERRQMLKQRARASQGKSKRDDRDESESTPMTTTKSQRRREQRKRKKATGSDDASPGLLPAKSIQISVPRKSSKHAAHEAIDMLANSESLRNVGGKKRKKKDVDEVEALALRHQKKFLGGTRKSSASGKSKKRWFEEA
jgi:nucleolar protein 4